MILVLFEYQYNLNHSNNNNSNNDNFRVPESNFRSLKNNFIIII